jgi:sodium/bile acid cotransporter 7
MLLPILVGQFARRFVLELLSRYGKYLRKSTSVLILLIVFITISRAVATGLFDLKSGGLPMALTYLAVSHFVFLAVIYGSTRLLGFSREDRISALYAAPQKTLAMGAPLLTIFFADRPELLAASIVPLSFYHLWQLIVAGFIRGALVRER